ncbi:MAG: hypothetical protein Q8R11_00680 [bacterium]|nr:hypothetical protein [bacterium]
MEFRRTFNRREFGQFTGKNALLLAATEFLRNGGPTLLPPITDQFKQGVEAAFETLRSPEGVKLAQQARAWVLPDGTPMTTIAPEVEFAAEILETRSLNLFIPRAQERVIFAFVDRARDTVPGKVDMHGVFQKNSPAVIRASGPSVQPYEIPLLSSLSFKIELAEYLRGTHAALVVGIKETSQIVDYLAYCRVYRRLLEQQGARFELINPKGTQISDNDVTLSVAQAQMSIEMEQREEAWLERFIDMGSFLRVGSILFANWLVNYGNKEKMPAAFSSMGHESAGFLQAMGFLEQRGRKAMWVNGRAPQIDEDTFVPLLNKFLGI